MILIQFWLLLNPVKINVEINQHNMGSYTNKASVFLKNYAELRWLKLSISYKH